MIIKLLWCSLMCIVTIGILFFSAVGISIPEAYYEKSESFFINPNGR